MYEEVNKYYNDLDRNRNPKRVVQMFGHGVTKINKETDIEYKKDNSNTIPITIDFDVYELNDIKRKNGYGKDESLPPFSYLLTNMTQIMLHYQMSETINMI